MAMWNQLKCARESFLRMLKTTRVFREQELLADHSIYPQVFINKTIRQSGYCNQDILWVQLMRSKTTILPGNGACD